MCGDDEELKTGQMWLQKSSKHSWNKASDKLFFSSASSVSLSVSSSSFLTFWLYFALMFPLRSFLFTFTLLVSPLFFFSLHLVFHRLHHLFLSSVSSPCRKQRTSVGPSKTLAQPRRNIVGCRIQHIWKEGSKLDLKRFGGLKVLDQGHAACLEASMKQKTSFFFPNKSVCVCVCFLLGKSSQWKGTVLDQVPVNPSLYLIKYDGFDCIYGLELYRNNPI